MTRLVALLLAVAWPVATHASGDGGCYPSWTLRGRELDQCSSMPFLGPRNDTRVNLMLLLADRGGATLSLQPDWDGVYEDAHVPFDVDALVGEPWMADDGEPGPPTLLALAAQLGVPVEADELHFADGEGSRCRSNDATTAEQFLTALIADGELPADERRELARSRVAMLGVCAWSDERRQQIAPAGIRSPHGQQLAAYLTGAMAFYEGDFPGALRQFDELRLAEQPWVREAAVYMVGRTWLNDAQEGAFDEWGYLTDAVGDAGSLAVARAAFDDYLGAYPSGRYAASAKGLERRIDWLGKNDEALERAYGRLLADPSASGIPAADLVNEIDNKLLMRVSSDQLDDPRLLAVASLMAMRADGSAARPALDVRPALEARRAVFDDTPALWAYLQDALAFYDDGDGQQPLPPPLGPDEPLDYLAFSRETLRGLTLESQDQWREAEAVWLGLLPKATRPLQRGQLELALAFNYEQSDRVDAVFAEGSPVRTPGVRSILLRYAAGPQLLRRQAKNETVPQTERDRALFTLLYKDLMRGHYGDFGTDVGMLPPNVGTGEPDWTWPPDVASMLPLFEWPGGADEGYPCPPVRDVAAALARDAKSPVGLNCLGELILRNDLDGFLLDQQPAAGQLGNKASPAWGKPYSRLDGYMQVMKEPKASTDDRAYALYRAVNCFGPSGYNGCGSQEIDVSERRTWFRTLKGRYARTPWAERLEYYVVTRLAALLVAGVLSAGGHTVDASKYDAFWLWAGVAPQPVLARARTVYVLHGQVGTLRDGVVGMTAQGSVPRLKRGEVWVVYRAHTLHWPETVYATMLAQLARWERAGNPVVGVQIDFDAGAAHLAGYADFLRDLRRRLPARYRLGITGLLDWGANADPEVVNELAGVVDEVVVQTYQGRRTITDYEAYLPRVARLTIPFKIGVIQHGEWHAPDYLGASPWFRGYVVFLQNPPPA